MTLKRVELCEKEALSEESLLEFNPLNQNHSSISSTQEDNSETGKPDHGPILDSTTPWHRYLHREQLPREKSSAERPKSWSDTMVNIDNLEETRSASAFYPKDKEEKLMTENVNSLECPLSDTEVDKVKKYEEPLARSLKGWRTWFSKFDNRPKPQVDLNQLEEGATTTQHQDYGLSPSSTITLRSRSVEEVSDLYPTSCCFQIIQLTISVFIDT
jgi:hypothetical protein